MLCYGARYACSRSCLLAMLWYGTAWLIRKTVDFGPSFWQPALLEAIRLETKKRVLDRCPISPTQAKSTNKEGHFSRSQSQTGLRAPGPALGASSHMLCCCYASVPYSLLLLCFRPICLLLLAVACLFVAMLAGGLENAIFHKGNGLETHPSEFSGLRMRDGRGSILPPPRAPFISCARPD